MDIHSVFGILSFRHPILSSTINIAAIDELYTDLQEFNPMMFQPADYPDDLDLLLAEPDKTLVFRKPPIGYAVDVRQFEIQSFLAMAKFLGRISDFDRVIEISGTDDEVVEILLANGCTLLFDATKTYQEKLFRRQENECNSNGYWKDLPKTFEPHEFSCPKKTGTYIPYAVLYEEELPEDRQEVIAVTQTWDEAIQCVLNVTNNMRNWLSLTSREIGYLGVDPVLILSVFFENFFSPAEINKVRAAQYLLRKGDNSFAMNRDLPIPNIEFRSRKRPETAFGKKVYTSKTLMNYAVTNASRDSKTKGKTLFNDHLESNGIRDVSAVLKEMSSLLGLPGMIEAFNAGVPLADICA